VVSVIVTGAVALVVLCVLGLAVLAPMRAGRRDALLPAAPVLGAALLAVVMSTTSWVVPARGGLLVAVLVAAGLVALAVRHGRRPWRFSRRAVVTAALVLVVGAVGAAVALVPTTWVGDGRAMSANSSHDIYYYVAESTWLLEHPIAPGPQLGLVPGDGNATPADNPMRATLAIPLRIGQPMVQAALMVATGQRAVDSVMVLTALWVLLVAPAAFVAARLLRVRPAPAFAVAVVSATSALLLQQAYQQNVDALLGVSVALLTLATCVTATERRVPVPLAALVLVALVAVYTEYAVFVAPAVLAGVLLRRRHRCAAIRRAAAVLALAVALAPTAWARGAGVLAVDRAAEAAASPLYSDGRYLAVSRFVGTAPLTGTGTNPGLMTAALAGLLVLGWVLAVLVDRYRGLWLTLLVVGLGYLAFVTVEGRGYTQLRSASLLLPLLLLASGSGWAALLRVLGSRTRARGGPVGRTRSVVAVGLVASAAVFAVVNLRSAPAGLDRGYVTSRHVDVTFDDIGEWVAEHGGPDGEAVTALVPDIFAQMWAAEALRDTPLVAYPALRPDYLGLTSYWAGESDRFLLVGPGAHVWAGTGAVVEQNDRFQLVDLWAGPAVAVTPMDLPAWWPAAAGDGAMTGPDLGTVLVLRSSTATSTPTLELSVPGRTGPVDVLLTVVETGTTTRAVLDSDGTAVPVDLDGLTRATITVDLAADGVASSETFALIGVTGAT